MKTFAISALAGFAAAGNQPAAGGNANANAGYVAVNYAVANPINLTNRCGTAGMIAVTIDEGPGQRTGDILNMLAEAEVDARVTFHITTQHLDNFFVEAFAQAARERGHIVGLRWNPPRNFGQMTDEEIIEGLMEESAKIQRIIGVHPRFLRLPHNSVDVRIQEIVTNMGFILTEYNLDAQDYNANSTPEAIANNYRQALGALGTFKGRFISLHHDSQDYAFLEPAIKAAILVGKEMGYQFVDMGQCLGERFVYKSDAAGQNPMLTNGGVAGSTGGNGGNTNTNTNTNNNGGNVNNGNGDNNTGNSENVDDFNDDDTEDSGEGFVTGATLPDVFGAGSTKNAGICAALSFITLFM